MKQSDYESTFDGAATAYDRRVGRWSRLYIPSLLAAARIKPGDTVLDVATGTGEVICSARQAVAPDGVVLGCDISVPMLLAAKSRTLGTGLAAMNAMALACGDGNVDVVTCQLGLMFFPEVSKGLSEFHRVLREGGWMAASVWSSEERAPFVSIFPDVIANYVSVSREVLADGTSLGDKERLRDLVAEAGFRSVRVTATTHQIDFVNFEEYWEPIEAGGSPTAMLYVGLPKHVRSKVKEDVRDHMQPYFIGDRLIFETEALTVAGRK